MPSFVIEKKLIDTSAKYIASLTKTADIVNKMNFTINNLHQYLSYIMKKSQLLYL